MSYESVDLPSNSQATSSSTQTVIKLCDSSTQTETVIKLCDASIQTHKDAGSCSTQTSDATPDTCPTSTIMTAQVPVSADNAPPPVPASNATVSSVNIPTNNPFDVLEIEDTIDDDFPPLPLPWIKVTKKRRRRSSRITNKPNLTTISRSTCVLPSAATPEQPTAPPQSTPAASSTHTPRTRKNHTVLILGDSIPKYLDGKRMSHRLQIYNESIPGIRLEQLTNMAYDLITSYNPSCVIIHCGTNDIPHYNPSVCVDLLTELVHVISSIKPTLSIAVSSLTIQGNNFRTNCILEFNSRLFDLCRATNIASYIDNSNIGLDHLTNKDYIHLKGNGIRQLAKNFISFLRYISTVIMNT